jgi:hypothetical protein
VSTPQRLVIAVAAACLAAGCAAGAAQPHAPVAAETSTAAPTTQQLSGPQPIPGKAAVIPIRVAIPAIGVRQSTLEVLTRDPGTGELRPPVDFTKVGYYREGPVPGDPGPAVLAGHVDDTTGPKVFFRLRELKAGDQVLVTRSDGRDVLFHVDAVEQYPKGAFPTNAVYGPAPGSSLRLITCGGTFDAAARSYRDNIVVYASKVAEAPTPPAG